jgi:hypothetical protein
MTRINPSAGLIARIQSQLRSAASLRALRAAKATRDRSDASSATQQDLTSAVVSRVALIDKDDPDCERKALRVFLEAVLLAELGTELADDPRFQDLLDHVQRQFADNAELNRAASEAARHLLSGARS